MRLKCTTGFIALSVLLGCRPERPAAEPESVTVSDVGLQTPESVVHDPVADVYLVSNINGSPLEKDDNGFITRLAPSGEVLALKWIDGAGDAVALHAPKGMALKGDTLFVADIDEVRLFHRETGSPLGSRPVPGSTFLNDLTVGPDGTLYVTDSGLRAGDQGFAPSGTDAVYRFDATGQAVPVVRDTALGRPNGILADDTALTVVTFGSGEIYRLDPASGAKLATLPRAPGGQLDGLVRLADGSLLVSSWECQCVYQVHAEQHYMPVVESVPAPADIGFDARRNRVLIPLFTENRVLARRLTSQL